MPLRHYQDATQPQLDAPEAVVGCHAVSTRMHISYY